MPEGDTIHHAANRIRPVLEGRVPEEIRTPQRRHAADRWPERLRGRRVGRVEARGKHLLLHFDGELVLHSHLRMSGSWDVHARGAQWRRSPRRAWLVMTAAGAEVVQFDGPLLELMTEARARTDPQLAHLGPDVLGARFDEREVIVRLRADDPTRPLGDALIDQRTIAGLGNIWKSESCFAAQADPWRAARRDARCHGARHRPLRPRAHGPVRARRVHRPPARRLPPRRPALPALRRHRSAALARASSNRTTYWCPGCQR